MKSRGRLFLFLTLALVAGLWYLWPNLQNTVSVQNRSTKTITHLTITVGEQTESLDNIAPGTIRATTLHFGEKTHYSVKGEFEDKTPLEKLGTFYINEPGHNVVLTVRPDGNILVDPLPPKS
jgi:hypothetical protein